MTKVRNGLNVLLLIGIILIVWFSNAFAATTWTAQSGTYIQYKVPPTMTNKYVLSTATLEVPTSWIKQPATFTKYVSTGGSVEYRQILITTIPAEPVDDCKAQFICHKEFGWIINLSMNRALKCPSFKIIKDEIYPYEGAQSINGEPTCITK